LARHAGTLTVGANESTSLYLLRHIETFRRLHPKIGVRVRRSLSSKIPNELLDGNLELGVISYDPPDERLTSTVIYTDALAFVVSPKHRLARRRFTRRSQRRWQTDSMALRAWRSLKFARFAIWLIASRPPLRSR